MSPKKSLFLVCEPGIEICITFNNFKTRCIDRHNAMLHYINSLHKETPRFAAKFGDYILENYPSFHEVFFKIEKLGKNSFEMIGSFIFFYSGVKLSLTGEKFVFTEEAIAIGSHERLGLTEFAFKEVKKSIFELFDKDKEYLLSMPVEFCKGRCDHNKDENYF